ncbi:hypothetical protein LOK49_LG02G01623 [Camellia lanceoleosa]|uniref:Uncharacterized protein n=1 Tax=Camellia lanceoleosa TaxID=1840588 RepID=A0ACC0IR91_9ERIC|nr:hypothetical protein LOK49_LG02G01623 [Camellia lanceoleosa]
MERRRSPSALPRWFSGAVIVEKAERSDIPNIDKKKETNREGDAGGRRDSCSEATAARRGEEATSSEDSLLVFFEQRSNKQSYNWGYDVFALTG